MKKERLLFLSSSHALSKKGKFYLTTTNQNDGALRQEKACEGRRHDSGHTGIDYEIVKMKRHSSIQKSIST